MLPKRGFRLGYYLIVRSSGKGLLIFVRGRAKRFRRVCCCRSSGVMQSGRKNFFASVIGLRIEGDVVRRQRRLSGQTSVGLQLGRRRRTRIRDGRGGRAVADLAAERAIHGPVFEEFQNQSCASNQRTLPRFQLCLRVATVLRSRYPQKWQTGGRSCASDDLPHKIAYHGGVALSSASLPDLSY